MSAPGVAFAVEIAESKVAKLVTAIVAALAGNANAPTTKLAQTMLRVPSAAKALVIGFN